MVRISAASKGRNMKLAILTADSNGGYPVPASRGGAVSTLVEHIVEENNKNQLLEMDVFSLFDADAKKKSRQYSNINWIWICPPRIIRLADDLLFLLIRRFFKNKKSSSYKSIFSLIYYIIISALKIKKTNYEKIVIENNIPLAWVIKLSGYKGDYYYHLHNVPRINAGCKDVFHRCTLYLCVSKYVANQICLKENAIGPVPIEKIRILYNCIDKDQFKPLNDISKINKLKKKYNVDGKMNIICYVGRLSREKGVDKVLEAVLKLGRKDIILLITGSYIHNSSVIDEFQKSLYILSKELGDRVKFTGYIPQDKVHEIFQISDVAVLPSIWDEPAGLTMVESLACGTPVITTNSGGIPEYMKGCATIINRDSNIVSNICNAIEDVLSRDSYIEFDCIGKKDYFNNFYKSIQ